MPASLGIDVALLKNDLVFGNAAPIICMSEIKSNGSNCCPSGGLIRIRTQTRSACDQHFMKPSYLQITMAIVARIVLFEPRILMTETRQIIFHGCRYRKSFYIYSKRGTLASYWRAQEIYFFYGSFLRSRSRLFIFP